MGKSNGKPDIPAEVDLDLDRELPEGGGVEPSDEARSAVAEAAQAMGTPAETSPELQALQKERDGLLDRLARQQAEFENYRKRAAREQQDFRDYALSGALLQILPALDSFDRALKAENVEAHDFRAGVELINRQLHDALTKLGVTPIPAEGEMFDPKLHEAVQVMETDEVEDNRVVRELQRGYRLKDRLLRPAMVVVARNPNS
jgi:molecular chaperone GrpE